MLLNAIMMVLHKAIDVNGELVAESFVDDLTLLSSKTQRHAERCRYHRGLYVANRPTS